MNEHVTTRRRPATYQDVIDAPETMVAELVRGALHLSPRPASPHARAASVLGGKIGGPFDWDGDGPGGWWILDEPELHLGDDVLVPDLAGWRRARMPDFPDAPWFDLAPDWVCEVLSPGTRRLDLTDKRDIYGRSGVGHLWLVDPKARTLEAFARRDGAWVLLGARKEDDEVRLPPFDAVALPLGALWPD
jgi:Putative restriction endonuclease